MKNIKNNRQFTACMPFAGITPFHKKIEDHYKKVDVKTVSFPSMGGYRFF